MNHPFKAGGRYKNNKGSYEVMALEGERMLILFDNGTEQMVDLEVQTRIWERIQDESQPQPLPQRYNMDDQGLDTQPVGDLVQTVLNSRFSFPYPKDITDQVCSEIEENPE